MHLEKRRLMLPLALVAAITATGVNPLDVPPRRVAVRRPAEGFAPDVAGLLRNPACADVVVCSHRGNGAGPPENSISAIRAAAAAGALVIEVDVRETRDDVLVLMHDGTVARTTDGGRRSVGDMTLAEVRGLVLKETEDERPPTLAEAIAAARGRTILQLDLKTDRMDLVAATVARTEAFGWITAGKGSLDRLRELKRLEPRIEVIPRARVPSDLDAMLAEDIDPVAVQVPENMLEPVTVGRIRAAGSRVWANALGVRDILALRDEAAAYRPLIAGGADIIQTDRPKVLLPFARAASRARYPW